MTNKEFNRLSNKDKRIALAKDVIKQLEANKIIPTCGVFVQNWELRSRISRLNEPMELQLLLENYPPCLVCAKGALFITDIMARNNFSVDKNKGLMRGTANSVIPKRLPFFSILQLNLIEKFFEGWVTNADSAYKFKTKYPKDNERLIKIMQNIIDNDGKFVPEKLN